MATPLVSVSMITYNHEPYIRKAIDSVLSQKTGFPFELVIGEDNSTDGTREIVFDYASRFPDVIRVVTSEKNVGMKKNYVRTNMACAGKYMAYCEGDDFWQRDDKLRIQADYLERHPECGLVCADYDVHYTTSGVTVDHETWMAGKPTIRRPTTEDILEGKANILTCTVMVRRELAVRVFEADPFLHLDDHFQMGDSQQWTELSLLSEVHQLDETLATHQLLRESASQSGDERKALRFWISNSELGLYLCDKHGISGRTRRLHESNWIRQSLKLAFLTSDRELAAAVKSKHPKLGMRDLAWYWGARNPLARRLLSVRKTSRGRK